MTTENTPAPPEKPESCEDKPFGVQLGTSKVDADSHGKRAEETARKGERCDDELIVGIDLGTTFSLIAAIGEDGAPFCVSGLVPSVVHFAEDGTVTVGWPAREKAIVEPRRTVFSVKRLMGKGMDEVETELDLVPYSVVDRDQKLVMVRVGEKDFTPQEVSALILKEIKKLGEQKLGRPVKKAVITVPAYFDDAQRQATRDAGRIAGLDVLRIVNEPTAAALAYGLGERGEGTIAVYDLGGGTFDCSILRISGGVFQVLSTNGDTRLGGDDIDRKLMELAAPELQKAAGRDPRADPVLLRGLREAAEKAKCELSGAQKTELTVNVAGVDFRREVTRAELDGLIEDLVERTIACCRAAVKDAGLCTKEIDEVVMVGGSTRVPRVRERVGEYFGRAPHTELDPDQVVALGAAVQANILAGGTRDMLLLDVTPLSLGIETFGGAVSKLIMRNSTVPARATEEFTTFVEGQTSVDIHIVQGERELAKDCRSLGRFKLRGLPPMPAGIPRIEVGYLIDENGILTVTAIEKRSGRAASVEIVPSHGLTGDEVDRMVSESIEHAAEDIARHRLIALRNEAETVLRATDGAIDRHRGILEADLVRTIEASSAALRDMLMTSENPDELHKAIQKLTDDTKPLADIVLKVAVKGELEGARVPKEASDEQKQKQEQEASK